MVKKVKLNGFISIQYTNFSFKVHWGQYGEGKSETELTYTPA